LRISYRVEKYLVRSQQELADRLQMGDTFLRDTIEQGKVLYERPGE
jgi:hypothetical protein